MINPKISVIVCTYNGEKRITHLLDSLKKQTYKNLEIVIVDDGSSDGTSDIVKKYPFRLIRHRTNRGLADSRNTGIKSSKGDIIIFTDDDCVADKNWVREIAKCYSKNRDINAAGGRIEPYSLNTYFEKYEYYGKQPIYSHSTSFGSGGRIKNYLSRMFSTRKNKLKDGQKLSSVMGLNSSYKREIK